MDRMVPFDTLRSALRDSDGSFRLAWVEDMRKRPGQWRFSEDRPYIVVTAFGRKDDGGELEVMHPSYDRLEDALEFSDSIVDNLVKRGGKHPEVRFHGFRDATWEEVEKLGLNRVQSQIFSVVSIRNSLPPEQ